MVFDSDSAMQNIITHIGKRAQADRCYYFNVDKEKKLIDNEYEWCADGIESQQDSLRNVPFDTLPAITAKITNNEWVAWNTHEMPPEWVHEQMEFIREGITSIVTVPVSRGNETCGFFGIDSVKKGTDWSQNKEVLNMLTHAAYGITAVLNLGKRCPWLTGRRMPWSLDAERVVTATSTYTCLAASDDNRTEDHMRNKQDIAELITQEFEKIRKRPEADKWDEIGRHIFKGKVQGMIDEKKTVAFVLPGFPFKSTNHVEKVLGPIPDLSEKLAIETLHKFAKNCSNIYSLGVVVDIVSDGRVFADIAGCTPEDVVLYQTAVRSWFPSPYINWLSLADVFTDASDDVKRERLMALYGSSLEKIDTSIKEDQDYNMMYCGFKRFFTEENIEMKDASKSTRSKYGAQAARMALYRNEAYSAMVDHLLSKHIRMSIHPHDNVKKFGINLVGESDWGTPWHNVAVLGKDGKFKLIKRQLAEKDGCKLKADEQGMLYFVEQ